MIKLDKVTKKYPSGQIALDEVSLEIKEGEFVFLVGPSGVGKTTFLRLFTREVRPTSGKIFIGEQDILMLSAKKVPYLRRRIGTIFQDFKLLLDRTIFENVAVPLEVTGKSEKEIEREVSEILEKVGLLEKANSFPIQLSGGEVQRTAIARAIVGSPQVLLADEPTADLDPITAEGVVDLLDAINKERKTTIIMATHNIQIVNKYKKRVLTLKEGKIATDVKEGRYEAS
jgi:cell division transport system ATP-binding protein